MTLLTLLLIGFELFPGPPPDEVVARMVIDHYRADTAFQREYGMTEIQFAEIYMQGEFGEYECGDGVKRKGWPIRTRMDYWRGSPEHRSTYFTVWLFERTGPEITDWVMHYSPRLRFENVLGKKKQHEI